MGVTSKKKIKRKKTKLMFNVPIDCDERCKIYLKFKAGCNFIYKINVPKEFNLNYISITESNLFLSNF